jgi:hypothetical protein
VSIAITFWRDPPLPADESGYCYRDRGHFDKVMYRAAQRLINQHGAPIDRCAIWIIAPLVAVLMIILFAVPAPSALSQLTRIGAQVGLLAFGLWHATRARRFVAAIVKHVMCLECGYALLSSPTDEHGQGTCPECGTSFCLAQYHRPPRRYLRTASTRRDALFGSPKGSKISAQGNALG